jgi:phosphoribosylamine--glycine ligase
MNILLIGSGGREHALAWALAASPRCDRLFALPGNPGMEENAVLVEIAPQDHQAIIAFCRSQAIDFVVVGPEGPLVAGLVDDLAAHGIKSFGPSKAAAQLEGSKGYTKDLCREYGIPTAAYKRFSSAEPAKAYIRETGAPIVVKADGLAAGKGVVVALTISDAIAAVDSIFGAFSAAEIVVEECLIGEEVSFFALCDGEHALPFGTAQDHKRAFDGDLGPNTGGMGAYSPAPLMTAELEARVRTSILDPTMKAMKERGTPFRGVLYAGLMITSDGPKLIEYNVRFGDPETQVLIPRLDCDLLTALIACADGNLRSIDIAWKDEAALCVVMATNGYPGSVENGSQINGIEKAASREHTLIFHAGTRRAGSQILANGGRVLGVTGTGSSIAQAQARAYEAVDLIDWPNGFCRRDIGWRAVGK